MKNPVAVGLFLSILCPSLARAELLISEMCDPRLNFATDRFIEIYNTGPGTVDLTGWTLVAVGNNANIFTWNLSGNILAGEALVAGDQTTTTAFPVDFPAQAWSTSNSNWNGGNAGDGAKLIDPLATVVDFAVVPNSQFENEDFVRNSNINAPNTTYTQSEWTGTPVDFATQASPGTHVANPPPPEPVISGITVIPAAPLTVDSVHVEADVVDTAGAIVSAVLRWGTAPTPLPQTIVMQLDSGDTYRTSTPIPPQAAGTIVYFLIEANNDLGGVGTSSLQSYALPTIVTIHDVQGQTLVSPYAGEGVITTGVVTARFESTYVLQDGTGPWNGLWVQGASAPALAETVTVQALVDEGSGATFLTSPLILEASPGPGLPPPANLFTSDAALEAYEGVLVSVNGTCTNHDLGAGEWEVNDGSGPVRIDDLGFAFAPILGSTYSVTGPVLQKDGSYKIEPRDAGDVIWTGDLSAPVVFDATAENATTVRVTFSEEVEEGSAETEANYSIPGLSVNVATRDGDDPDQVVLSVSSMASGDYTLTVGGVEDLYENIMSPDAVDYTFFLNDVPPGYYDPAAGHAGEALRAALHGIIDNHTVRSYDFAWTAFYTTDDKPNGKVWDIYSDVPGGTPPYEYTFGVDQGGAGGVEGTGYNREHSWPQSWFGGEVPPMRSDLFQLYPTDNWVNGQRGNFPYGETSTPYWTSQNGSKLGDCSFPGYGSTVFEPIDEYKGDLARTYFYFSTRYYSEDGGWPGSPMADGADLVPWAVALLLQWHAEDPVSLKELQRNSVVFGFQGNRNPFIDRPEYAALAFGTLTSVEETAAVPRLLLQPASPNPFRSSTTIRFSVPEARNVLLAVFDVSGRRIATLASGHQPAGEHVAVWDGREANGNPAASGVYFVLLETGALREARRAALVR